MGQQRLGENISHTDEERSRKKKEKRLKKGLSDCGQYVYFCLQIQHCAVKVRLDDSVYSVTISFEKYYARGEGANNTLEEGRAYNSLLCNYVRNHFAAQYENAEREMLGVCVRLTQKRHNTKVSLSTDSVCAFDNIFCTFNTFKGAVCRIQ